MTRVPPTAQELVDFATEVAREAGRVTLDWFGRADLDVQRKVDGTPVTEADRAAERHVRARLAERYPHDAVHGEEESDRAGSSGRTWVIDPIDGTKAFSRGVPLYSNLVALIDEHGPAVGVINLPALGETVWAGRGLGAFADGTRCGVSTRAELTDAYVCTSEVGYWQHDPTEPHDPLEELLGSGVELRTWGDAYGYALVATGHVEAMVDPIANPWDVAPVAVIIPEAGGRFSSVDGAPDWRAGSGLATNGVLHDQMLALLNPADPPGSGAFSPAGP